MDVARVDLTDRGRLLMRPFRPSSPWAEILVPAASATVLVMLLSVVGCDGLSGGQPPQTEERKAHDSKVQALFKQGKSLSEIRAIMRGEPEPKSKKGRKKPARKH
jgi:hypothetical protein